ncbi:unnamed protein product [Adineta steineri]|uniref:NHL repeat containing protein-like protein n=1 Tax=Adineta steineri TaxID=433720 RepID=A0A814MJH3_9BILA|nr:unnamed protein product [Adineta steineri]CAF4016452.1 unnamed protein product [Adineta steineri]
MIGQLSGLSFNQPKFCSLPAWNSVGITFATNNIISGDPYSLFITSNNSIYVVDRSASRIYIWLNNSFYPTITISNGLSGPRSVFVYNNNNDAYIDNGNSNNRVDKWILNTNTTVPVMSINSSCYSLFIDTNNTLYCSLDSYQIVVKKWLRDNNTTPITAAGNGTVGSAANTFNYPNGLFIDSNFNLYVADCLNHRIQLFYPGQSNGITVAGATSVNTTITLNRPTGVTMDSDGYLYISDYYNNRMVRGGSNGFQCIIGCSGGGVASNQLWGPRYMTFDSYGNIYVADTDNYRVMKFIYSNSSCGPTTTGLTSITSTRTIQSSTTSMKRSTTILSSTRSSTYSILTTHEPIQSRSTKAVIGYLIQCLILFILYI